MTDAITLDPFETVDALEIYLAAMRDMPCAENGMSELDHALQTAFELKAIAPHDIELQIAGLLHDVAHQRCHIRYHETVGAHMLTKVMPERVVRLVGCHAEAKRFLVTRNPDYLAKLTPVSRASFIDQGGVMSAEEAARFDAEPLRDDAIKLRRADDLGKCVGSVVPGLEAWRAALHHVALKPHNRAEVGAD